jgi:transcriptional regulator with PAS, ATPase and Fis domain
MSITPKEGTENDLLRTGKPNISRTRLDWFRHIEQVLREQPEMSDAARQADVTYKVGYFARLEELANPVHEKILEEFITQDSTMNRLKDSVRKLVNEHDSVLIMGESGTGKEIIARALHGSRSGNFVCINCAGIPDNLIESELFGHVRGSFTGATHDKVGLLQEAQNGTIFLDEIGELPLSLQAKLLRALQQMSIRKVGGVKEESINCRFISATHNNLVELATEHTTDKTKGFRVDLYYRLAVFTLYTTPLRQRIDDIPLIVKSLHKKGKPEFPSDFSWHKYIELEPMYGNVRTIQSLVRQCQVLNTIPDLHAMEQLLSSKSHRVK